jgi:hypothetical protein
MTDSEFIDHKEIQNIVVDLRESKLYGDQSLGAYLDGYFNASNPSPLLQILRPIDQLGYTAMYLGLKKTPENKEASLVTSRMFRAWSINFIMSFSGKLRNALCGKKTDRNKLNPRSYAAVIAISSSIKQYLQVSSVTASGLAVLILLVILKAEKKSFCDMTDKEMLTALRNAD